MDLGKLMKEAQKMQGKMAEAQERLGSIEVTGSSGGGAVQVRANARQEITGLSIQPEVITPDDPELLEDMLLVAIKDAQRLARERQEEEMAKVTGGLGLPPGMLR
jgi:DNA-binding YbaB/EbfC family protein